MNHQDSFLSLAEQLIAAGKFIDSKGWVPATSGNFSARLPDGTIAITVSGKHKGRLQAEDIMRIDAEAHSLDGKKPSAETLLHTYLYKRFPDVQSVLHPHPLNAVLVSKLFTQKIVLADYELLKAFAGISTHESQLVVPIFANDQNIPRLAAEVENYLDSHNDCQAYIIAGHGLYTWGRSVQETLYYLEALDFLFACELQLLRINK
jgi:methylthioribulose-1-phosphate dehydratase